MSGDETNDPTVIELMSLIEAATPDTLLKVLDDERSKFTKSNEKKISLLVHALIEKGTYPAETVPGNPNDVLTMVEGWGVHWHEWHEPLNCPLCKSDLRDLKTGPPFGRQIGIYFNDRTQYYKCPDCKGRIERE